MVFINAHKSQVTSHNFSYINKRSCHPVKLDDLLTRHNFSYINKGPGHPANLGDQTNTLLPLCLLFSSSFPFHVFFSFYFSKLIIESLALIIPNSYKSFGKRLETLRKSKVEFFMRRMCSLKRLKC